MAVPHSPQPLQQPSRRTAPPPPPSHVAPSVTPRDGGVHVGRWGTTALLSQCGGGRRQCASGTRARHHQPPPPEARARTIEEGGGGFGRASKTNLQIHSSEVVPHPTRGARAPTPPDMTTHPLPPSPSHAATARICARRPPAVCSLLTRSITHAALPALQAMNSSTAHGHVATRRMPLIGERGPPAEPPAEPTPHRLPPCAPPSHRRGLGSGGRQGVRGGCAWEELCSKPPPPAARAPFCPPCARGASGSTPLSCAGADAGVCEAAGVFWGCPVCGGGTMVSEPLLPPLEPWMSLPCAA